MNDLEVRTRDGTLRGARLQGGIRTFFGIPYAEPPVGPLRWKPPRPGKAWVGVRDATRFGLDCPQADTGVGSRAPGQGEDCLTLNVWTPPPGPDDAPRPVLVWVHGGSFVAGSGSEERLDGAKLAAQGLVVVTINYRVGLFGFYAHPGLTAESPEGYSGNQGLLDQLLALKWLRENIAAFGGDAGRITAFGVSAGSASLALLLTSPLAEGAFDQAILESPGTARPLVSLKDAEQAGLALGSDIQTLRSLPASEILGVTGKLAPKVRGLTTPRVLRPIRDGHVIPLDEADAYAQGKLHPMPLILGTNLDEGTQAVASWNMNTVEACDALIQVNFGDWAARAGEHYPATNDAEAGRRVAELFADTQFNYGTRLLARTMAAKGAPVYRYVFTRLRQGQHQGPNHGDEVAYVFGNLSARYQRVPTSFDATDAALSEAMMARWSAFARTARPAEDWQPYDEQSDAHLVLGDRLEPGRHWRKAQLDFLESYFQFKRSGA